MKSREEIEAIALELYPDKSGVYRIRSKNRLAREAFIKGYELAQQQKKCGYCVEPQKEKG